MLVCAFSARIWQKGSIYRVLANLKMPDKKTRTSPKQMSQVRDDLLQQALQQVKALKSKLESSEQADPSLLQKADEQIDSLRRELSKSEVAKRELRLSLQKLEELKGRLEQSELTNSHRLVEALRQVQNLQREVKSLEAENTRLKQQCENRQPALSDTPSRPMQLTIDLLGPALTHNDATVNQRPMPEAHESATTPAQAPQLSAQEKIALFAELFASRRDVYAVRWESRSTGKSGYSPAREHQEFHGRTSCPGPPTCRDQPLTDGILKEHLQGKTTIGVFPMMENEMCRFVAIDLDQKYKKTFARCTKVNEPWSEQVPLPKRELERHSEAHHMDSVDPSWSWEEDASALMNAAHDLNVPAYLERSRSGKGAHIWIFFEEPISAALARRLAEALITKAERDTGQLSLRSYDRMFPNQDTMPQKGYGNLIALPLQKISLSSGNSAFLDESMVPYIDQWAFLQSISRMSGSVVEAFVLDATRRNALMPVDRPSETEAGDKTADPWALPPSGRRKEDTNLISPLPARVNITLSNFVYIAKSGLTRSHLNRIERIAAFQNPQFYKNQNLRLSNYKTPRIISCAEEFPEHLALPRGCLDDLTDLLNKSGVEYNLDDKRFSGRKIRAKFKGKLRDEQTKATQSLLDTEMGILSAVPGFGKTVIAAYCISKRKVNTLVLVHRQQLLDQWKDRLGSFLELPAASIGQIGGGKKKPTGIIDVATVQSLTKKGAVDDLVAEYGQVIVDECHGVGSVEFEQVLRQVKAKWVIGLTATPVRYDGHHPIIAMQCGPIRHRIRHQDIDSGIAEHIVVVRNTNTRLPEHGLHYGPQEIMSELAIDEARNQAIVDDVLHAIAEKRAPLVLTKRKEHLQLLYEKLEGRVKDIIVFHGGLGLKKLNALTKKLEATQDDRVVLAIGQCIGEGFDDSRLDTLFLAMPISFRGRLEQYVGRLHRAHERKSIVKIYDYVDIHIEKMYRMFKKRQAGYKQIGYKMQMP
ncbi:MAG TPA: DEAD/DEAH box helicase family protein [Planktothrix sp.]